VPRTARFYQLGRPGPDTRSLWVACHGYGQLAASFASAMEPAVADDRVIVVPEGLSRFYLDDPRKRHGPEAPIGASWMTREDRESEIRDHVEYLDLLVAQCLADIGKDVPVVALGFSQGVATVCRWAALGGTSLQRLILWGGTLPIDLPADRGPDLFRGAAVTLVAGRTDKLSPPDVVERDRERLEASAIPVEMRLHMGGHMISSQMLRSIAAQ
jgi:predicted esterase